MVMMDQMQIDIGTTKKGRAYHRKKDKKNTPEEQKFLTEAAIYLRISSEMQRDGFSIEAQKLACRKCVEEKGYHLNDDHIYIDEAFTAKNEDRPAFKKMMVDAYTAITGFMDPPQKKFDAAVDPQALCRRILVLHKPSCGI